MHRNHPNWFANFKIMIMSFIAMLPVSRSPFSAWSDRCLTFFSLVRHVSQLGKTHVSPFSIPDSNTDFEFATGRTLQPVHLVCIPSRISLFCIDPDDFKRSSRTRGKSVVGGSSQPHVWRHPNFVWVQFV